VQRALTENLAFSEYIMVTYYVSIQMEVSLAREPFKTFEVFLSAFKLQTHYGTSDVEVGLTECRKLVD
jgi:hypothetical protein